MPHRPSQEFRPDLEGLEARRPLSVGASSVPGFATPSSREFHFPSAPAIPLPPITLDRVTNPKGQDAQFNPPFGHVLVQSQQPVPGQVYNILFLSVYNDTKMTFTASDNLTIKTRNTPAGEAFPILTGDQVWKPGGRIVFYVLSKQFYPLVPTQSSGFVVNFSTPVATAVPGPSGIALRIKYNPATFLKTLDYYVTSGPGSYGHQLGLPDTAIWYIVPDSGRIVHL